MSGRWKGLVVYMEEKGREKKAGFHFSKDHFLILLLMGILLMVIVWPVEEKEQKSTSKSGQWDSENAILNVHSEMTSDVVWEQEGGEENTLLIYAASLEASLERILSAMDGVGKVRVMVTLQGSGEAVVEKDVNTVRNGTTEVDSAGGSRNTTSINDQEETVYQGGKETPYIKKVLSPRVEGVVVCAQGGGNAKTVQNITEAIQALFGIEAHKIKVVKMISQ